MEAAADALEPNNHLLPRGQSPAEEQVTHFLTRKICSKPRRAKDHRFRGTARDYRARTKPLWMTKLKTFISKKTTQGRKGTARFGGDDQTNLFTLTVNDVKKFYKLPLHICLEGPSAVGKTTLAAALTRECGAAVVPCRQSQSPPPWFMDRHAALWQEVRTGASDSFFAVMDGDPIKGLWYNWIFSADGWPGLEIVTPLYRSHLERGTIAFLICTSC